MASISGSVGENGTNTNLDVKKVQLLLKNTGFDLGSIDGICGPITITGIEEFQKWFVSIKPDGLVEPNKKTWKKLSAQDWPFIHIQRQSFKSDVNWGFMFFKNAQGEWERKCYSYELPWITDDSDKSKKNISRIRIGRYKMFYRLDGPKGWRLQLKGTAHRTEIQIHRSSTNQYIKGCILPIHFGGIENYEITDSGTVIKQQSVLLMNQMKQNYN